jgi:hypothetical protein
MRWSEEAEKEIYRMLKEGRAVDTTKKPALSPEAKAVEDAKSEKAFMATVVKFARRRGYTVYHTHDSRKSAEGFPDLIIAKTGRLVVAELKMVGNAPTVAQEVWLDLFKSAGILTFVWYPRDWPEIEATLI